MGSHRRVYNFWAFHHRAPSLLVVISVLCVNINAIRVYEGTTHEHMLGVKLGKLFLISNLDLTKGCYSSG